STRQQEVRPEPLVRLLDVGSEVEVDVEAAVRACPVRLGRTPGAPPAPPRRPRLTRGPARAGRTLALFLRPLECLVDLAHDWCSSTISLMSGITAKTG